jgi:hypothetical protein
LQFDDEQISILLDGESVPTRLAALRVLEIMPETTPPDQKAAIESFRQGDFHAALPALIRCVSDHDVATRPPVWRQQWLSMLAAQAAMRSGRGKIALELVDQLDSRSLPPMTLGILPLDWTGTINDQDMTAAAVGRAGSPSLAVKLVAASWLLRSPTYRTAAESAVKRLAEQNGREPIAMLAGQLVWRTMTPPEIKAGLIRWESQLGRLPMALQSGPMVSMRDVVRRAGLEDAAKKWTWTIELAAPTWHPDL